MKSASQMQSIKVKYSQLQYWTKITRPTVWDIWVNITAKAELKNVTSNDA